jgi:ACS family glucarate transporter-like MFS transporter
LLLRPAPDGTRREPRQAPDLRPLARNRDLWLLGIAGFGGMWGTAGFITWANALMVKGGGVSGVQAGFVVTIFAIAGLVAKPLIGIVSDLSGARRKVPAALVFAAFVVTLLVFGTRDSLGGFLWVAPFLGVAAYMYSPLLVALVPKFAGVRLAGSAAGATNAFWQIASTIVPTVVGAVFAGTGSFLAAFAALAAGPLVGMVLVLLIDETSTPEPKIAEPVGEKEESIR